MLRKKASGKKMRKGSFEWETIAKYLIALVILILVIVVIGLFKDKLYNMFESLKGVFGNG